MTRLLLVGLDCVPPSFAFDAFESVMPVLSGLVARGLSGPLRSSEPPITVPAWTCMVTGRDPGELGLYGFRSRIPGSYGLRTARSTDVRVKRVWDHLADAGKKVAVLFVPLTYPAMPVRGTMLSCFLAPDDAADACFPRTARARIEAAVGPYQADVGDYRTDDLDRLYTSLLTTGARRFDVLEHVLRSESPDFAMMVEIGPDRFHHAFYRHVEPRDPAHVPGNPHAARGREYYAFLDARLGRALAAAGDDVNVIVASDHGARPLRGGVCINEWLAREGLLTLTDTPGSPRALNDVGVDWSRTSAWGEGGYYARIFLNVKGREPHGTVEPSEVEALRRRLRDALEALPGPDGTRLGTRVVFPEEAYGAVRGEAPDLLVYFGDLDYRSIGTVGHGQLFVASNDTGPDGCNHDWNGIVVAAGPAFAHGRVEGAEIVDVARTVLDVFGLPAPAGMRGRPLSERRTP